MSQPSGTAGTPLPAASSPRAEHAPSGEKERDGAGRQVGSDENVTSAQPGSDVTTTQPGSDRDKGHRGTSPGTVTTLEKPEVAQSDSRLPQSQPGESRSQARSPSLSPSSGSPPPSDVRASSEMDPGLRQRQPGADPLRSSQQQQQPLPAPQEQYEVVDGDGAGDGGLCRCLPLRYVIVWTVFVGMVVVNAMRTNVAVTVVTILSKEHHIVRNETGEIRELPSVNWNTLEIGYLHAIFYLGYMVTHLPAGYLTTRLPSHKLFGLCILVSCLLNLTLPVSIELGGYAVTMVIRFIQGLSEGVLYPACYGILRHWSTPVERGRLGSLVLTGAYLGPVVGFPMAGLITDYMGWPYIYYVNGGLGVVFVMVWAWLSEEKPAHHKKISSDELNLIEDLQGSERIDYEGARIPWVAILTSLPVMSLCLCNVARNWVFVLMLTNEPFFLDMFHFSLAMNGAMSAIPHLFKMSASLTSGQLADCLIAKQVMSTTYTRKLLTAGFGMQALFFVLLAQTREGTVAMVLLTLAIGFGGFVVSGWQLNHYDLSTRYASVLVAVSSTFGNIASVAAPILAGLLTDRKTFRGWQELFYITSGVVGVAFLSFLAFGSGERQDWSLPADTSQLVVKEDKRRRAHLADSKANGAKVKATSPDPAPQPAFTFSKLREEAGENSHPASGQVPNYGSADHTSVSAHGGTQ